jgi:cytochrome P450
VLRDLVAGIVGGLDDSAPVDFHGAVDRRIPSLVYCYLAGAPAADAPAVQSLSERTLSLLSRDRSLVPSILEAYDELFQYLSGLIARKREVGLGDDMLSYLIASHDEGRLTEQELLAEATSMLEASSVNTAHQTGLVVWVLLRDRAIWQSIVADPSLIPAAVVEATRLYPRTGVVSKIAGEDVELAGATIPSGSDVHVAVWSANRDPERFGSPETFDLTRERNQPLTFSTGPHNCLGQGLAKVEMEEVVRHLAEHHPDAVVVEDATRIGRVAGRWHVEALSVDLKP